MVTRSAARQAPPAPQGPPPPPPTLPVEQEEPQPGNHEGPGPASDTESDDHDYDLGSACNMCGTTVYMRDGDVTCLHMMRKNGYRQVKSKFYDEEGSHRHVTRISIPQWLYPNMLADEDQNDFNRDTFPGIRDFFLELYRDGEDLPVERQHGQETHRDGENPPVQDGENTPVDPNM